MRKLIKFILPDVGVEDLKIRPRGDDRCESANCPCLALFLNLTPYILVLILSMKVSKSIICNSRDLVDSIDTLFVKFETTLIECSLLQVFVMFGDVKLQDAIKSVNLKIVTNYSKHD